MRRQDRARGALYGLAIGDALGMPTQLLSRQQIVDRWGPLLTGFEAAPDDHEIAAGMPAGAVTDDTEQAVLLGRLLVAGRGRVDPGELAAALLAGSARWPRAGRSTSSAPRPDGRCRRWRTGPRRPRRAGTATPTAPRCGLPRSASLRPRTIGRPWSTRYSRRAW